MAKKTYRAEDTVAFPRKDSPAKGPQLTMVVQKGNIFDLDLLKQVPKNLHSIFTEVKEVTPTK